MARRQVLEVTCDRCKRTETQSIESAPQEGDELEVTFHGKTVKYADLCRRCRKSVENYFLKLTMADEEKTETPAPAPQKAGGIFGRKAG